MNTEKLYRQLVLEASKSPKYRGKIEGVKPLEGKNPTCGDKLDLYLKIENNKITGAKFEGTGCAISLASAHILCESVTDKSLAEAKTIIEAADFVKHFVLLPARVNCARLAWDTASKVCQKSQKVL